MSLSRWRRGGGARFHLLQPDSPGLHLILMFLCTEQIKDVGTNDAQLLGASSRSREERGSRGRRREGDRDVSGSLHLVATNTQFNTAFSSRSMYALHVARHVVSTTT